MAAPGHALIVELESAVSGGTPERRVEMLRKVTDLFLNGANRFDDEQVGLFDNVLLHLIQRIESKALARLSENFASLDNAPIEVVRRLARDEEVSVAGPVLAHSNRLSDSDLIDIARTRGEDHLLAMSERASISEGVTDVLVERGNEVVTRRLAHNLGARFSKFGFTTMIKRAEADAELAESLGMRLDLPKPLLNELMTRATGIVRSRLLAAAPGPVKERVLEALAAVTARVAREAAVVHDYSAAERLLQAMQRRGELNEAAIVEFASARRFEETVVALALLGGASVATVEAVMLNPRSDGLIVVCKAAGLKWPTLAAVLKTRPNHHSISEHELSNARAMLLALSQQTAQRAMRFWQTQEVARRAGMPA